MKDFNDLLDICSYLYDPKDSLPITIRYPRYWRVQPLGVGKLRFYQIEKYRTKPLPKIDLKRRRPSEKRSESPEAKRRRTSMTITTNNLPKPSPVPMLPSPLASQPPPHTVPQISKKPSPVSSQPQAVTRQERPRKMIVLKLKNKEKFATAVSRTPKSGVSNTASPMNPASPIPPPTIPVPAPSHLPEPPKSKSKLKLKLKFGSGGTPSQT